MMAESSTAAAETVSRIARSQEKEAKAAARAEQLEIILRELRATLAHSQEESIDSSKQVLSLEKAQADLEAQIHDLQDQLKLSSTEHLQQQPADLPGDDQATSAGDAAGTDSTAVPDHSGDKRAKVG